MFRIEMLPAQQGDALWIEYGDPTSPHRVLVDAGTPPTYQVVRDRIRQLPEGARDIELFIVTHIDTDHIGGALRLLADDTLGFQPGDIWFNGWRQLPAATGADRLGPIDGEILSRLIDRGGWSWNGAFSGGAAMVGADGPLPACQLAGGMTLTLLSPGPEQLQDLKREWIGVVRDAGLDPNHPEATEETLRAVAARKGVRADRLGGGDVDVRKLAEAPFVPDRSVANGSTIAVLAEFNGRSVLLGGDGFADVIAAAVRRLVQARGRRKLALDALKLPHHGSTHNLSTDLLSLLSCGRYLVSTSGAIFGHPDREAVARIIVAGGADRALFFNYRTAVNALWDAPGLRREFGYEVTYPAGNASGLVVDL
jgi:beta-lactamase superfamily II metal-dependent hydrolase